MIYLQNEAAATGNGSAYTVGTNEAALGIQVTGTFSATVGFEGTVDGSTWVAVMARDVTDNEPATSTTAAGVFILPVAGLRQVRAPVTWTSGTSVTVIAHPSKGAPVLLAASA